MHGQTKTLSNIELKEMVKIVPMIQSRLLTILLSVSYSRTRAASPRVYSSTLRHSSFGGKGSHKKFLEQ